MTQLLWTLAADVLTAALATLAMEALRRAMRSLARPEPV